MLNLFFLFMLPLNMLVSVVNDQSLSIWWLMFLACGFIVVFAIEKRRYSAEMIAHDKYIVEVQYEILEAFIVNALRASFSATSGRNQDMREQELSRWHKNSLRSGCIKNSFYCSNNYV